MTLLAGLDRIGPQRAARREVLEPSGSRPRAIHARPRRNQQSLRRSTARPHLLARFVGLFFAVELATYLRPYVLMLPVHGIEHGSQELLVATLPGHLVGREHARAPPSEGITTERCYFALKRSLSCLEISVSVAPKQAPSSEMSCIRTLVVDASAAAIPVGSAE